MMRSESSGYLLSNNDNDTSPPPSYEKTMALQPRSKWDPKTWSIRTRIIASVVVVIILVAIIMGAALGTKAKANAYPDYSRLSYTLQDTYAGTGFFDNFDYFYGYDPASGFVHYVPEDYATSTQWNLTYASETSAILKVDTTDTNASTGRYSVRISSKNQYNSGLFVFDVINSPYGCATWPALWLTGSDWPTQGEIDVMEAVNQANTGNQMTLHTTSGCTMKHAKRKETGKVLTSNCLNSTDDNAGCGVQGKPATFGQEFNENGGGIYAMELRDAGIRMWFFDRDSIPDDLPTNVTNTTAPDPSTWPEPLADFPSTHCDISKHFTNQSIIANIDLCGSWAGANSTYKTKDECPGTCEDFVALNNTAFETAFWEFASWRVYTAS